MTAPLSLTLLGGFQARLNSSRALTLPTKKAQALLACLALRPGQAHARARLAGLFWGDTGEEQARNSLRQALFALRRALPDSRPPALVMNRETVALSPAAAEVDVAVFEECVARATPEALERAAALYQGDLLEAFDLKEAAFEEWLLPERERLRELALSALNRLLTHQSAAGASERAVQTAMRLLALDPLQEAVHRTLMRLYARQERRGAALRQYQLCVGVLQRELGVEPEAETRQLYQEILQRRRTPESRRTEAPAAHHVSPTQPGAPRSQPGTPRLETPLIGRKGEWAALARALEEAWQGRGRAVAILGEAGIGKSRLVAELAAEGGRRGGRVLVGHCYELEQILPFRPWVDALGSGLEGPASPELEGLSPVWRAELARLLPEWAEAGLQPASAPDEYLRLFEAVAQLVGCLAFRQPLALILEDLHWADEMSLRLLGFLSRRALPWPVIIVGTVREEELGDTPLLRRLLEGLNREQCLQTLTLSPLAKADTESLARTLLGANEDEAALARLGKQIQAASEGNPFMVVETVRAIRQGTWPRPAGALPLPDRVREVIAGRLERLSERARQLAAVAAVIGREFDFALVQHAAGLAAPEAAEGMEELVRRRVLHGVGEHFDFTHDRIREVAYSNLLSPYRRLLHRRVAEALEELHADTLEPHYAALGVHYREGEVWTKALLYLRQAGVRAIARGAHREAVACLEPGVEILKHLPESQDTLRAAIDLRIDLRHALSPLGEYERLLEHLREAEAVAASLGDQHRLGWLSSYMAQAHLFMGHGDRALELGRRTLAVAEADGGFPLQIDASVRLSQIYWALGQYRRGVEVARGGIASLPSEFLHESFGSVRLPAVSLRHWLAWCLAELGEFAEAIAPAADAVRIAEAADHRFSSSQAQLALGVVHLGRGDLHNALRILEPGLEYCRAWDFGLHFSQISSALGYAHTLSGRIAEALPLLEQAAEQATSTNVLLAHTITVVRLSEAYLRAGRIDDATRLARHALDLSRERQERGQEAWALRLHGEIAAHGDPPDVDKAEASYREAVALAGELGMRPLVAHCHLGFGKLYRRTSKSEEARGSLATALTMYREMDMGFWLGRANAELKDVG
jgi:DNA-binding SARP family transcriptional activator